jgi:hypothetical protein
MRGRRQNGAAQVKQKRKTEIVTPRFRGAYGAIVRTAKSGAALNTELPRSFTNRPAV